MNDSAHETTWTVPALLISCTAISILSTDLYAPSMPHLPALLGTTASMVQLTLSVNFAAYAIAQLVHGPLADKFGARRILFYGLAGVAFTSLVCALADSISSLLAGRLLQGLCSSVPGVVVVVLIREFYRGAKATKIMGIHGMAIGLAPAMGPFIGGYIYLWGGWRTNFVILAGLAAVVAALIPLVIPATTRRAVGSEPFSKLMLTYGRLVTNREYMRYMLPLAAVYGALFAFVTSGPFLLIEKFGVPTEHYGLYYGAVIAAFIVGNLVTTSLAERLGAPTLAGLGVFLAVVGAWTGILGAACWGEQLITIMPGLEIFALGLGVLMGSGYVCLLDAAGDERSGIASAIAGSAQLAAASLAAAFVSTFYDGSARPMLAIIAAFATIAACIQFGLRSRSVALENGINNCG